ncbi:hypothetical protein N7540_004729 [Penicillium herquei]|nr:hypothetical protein N7540_004729 [Penicillium herquei]
MAGPHEDLSFVDALYASRVECPLHDHFLNPPQIWFSPGESPVWNLEGDSGTKTPVAIYAGTTFRAALKPESLGLIQALAHPLTLVGRAGEWTVFNSQERPTSDNPIDDLVRDLVVNPPIINGAAKALPWRLSSYINWTLSGNDPQQPIYECKTEVKVFVFPPNLPDYVVRGGLPVQLMSLNALWPEWMRSQSTDWAEFVIEAIFNDPRLEYETWSGSSRYTSGIITDLASQLGNNGGLELWLDLWLADMLGFNEVKTQINCYDLACLVQVLVSLGTDLLAEKIRAKFMSPYGYINSTKLIGRVDLRTDPNTGKRINPGNLCNNPFYGNTGYAPDMLVNPALSSRSAFGNHLFVTIEKGGEPFVLDACCGPQTGNVKLEDYPGRAIDTRSDRRAKPGTLLDITDGVGVNHLIVSRALARTNPPIGSDFLIDEVTELDQTVTWNAPFFASPAQNYSISATWTLTTTGDKPKHINVDVFRYQSVSDTHLVTKVQKAYAMRVATIEDQWMKETLNDGYSDGVRGSIRLFCNPNYGYLAVVRSTELKAADTATLKGKLKNLLDDRMIPKKKKNWIDNINTDKTLPIKVNESFRIILTVSSTPR